ncbi:MAG: hypothetical protein AAF942_05970 [Pseudomonadota bacterium]
MKQGQTEIGLNAAIVAVTEDAPRILTVKSEAMPPTDHPEALGRWADSHYALPAGPFEAATHRTLELGLRRWVEEQTGLTLGYVEQLYTFADRHRDPRELAGGPRIVTIGYLALVREAEPHGAGPAEWLNSYEFFPWEDWRDGIPPLIDRTIMPHLQTWIDAAPSDVLRSRRHDRAMINFGQGDAAWDFDLVLERYELLYEAGLVAEAVRDDLIAGSHGAEDTPCMPTIDDPAARAEVLAATGRPLELDHRRILATALGRIRGKLKYRPVVFELLPDAFTLLQLQRVVEALSGVRLHKQNFRRLVTNNKLVESTGKQVTSPRGRPAEQFRFRYEVLHERPAPGVGVPTRRVAL